MVHKLSDRIKIIPVALWILLILSFILRIYRLQQVPPSPSLDEVSIGYNAYSILKTGADEYGTKFPILLRAYDDWRPALYVYLVIPFIKIVGLNVLSVRLPSIILSMVTVCAMYYVTRELTHDKISALHMLGLRLEPAFFVTLLLAISPWHIYLSRIGHEVNLGLSLVVLGTLFFFRAIHNRQSRTNLFFSLLFFSASLYTYQS